MEIEKAKAAIEAILFACGREVKINELMSALELNGEDIMLILESLKSEYEREDRGIELIRINDGFQLTTKKEYYEYIYPIFDKRSKPNLSSSALETLSIIAYNPKITRPEIEAIRGVSSDAVMYKLLEYNLVEAVGKSDAPGKPTMYEVTSEFYKMFGLASLDELPELPRYKLDENQQIVIDEIIENNEKKNEEETKKTETEVETERENEELAIESNKKDEINKDNIDVEAPMPARETEE